MQNSAFLLTTMPLEMSLNDQIYQQSNMSSMRSNINIFFLKPDVRRKRRTHGVRRNGPFRENREREYVLGWPFANDQK